MHALICSYEKEKTYLISQNVSMYETEGGVFTYTPQEVTVNGRLHYYYIYKTHKPNTV